MYTSGVEAASNETDVEQRNEQHESSDPLDQRASQLLMKLEQDLRGEVQDIVDGEKIEVRKKHKILNTFQRPSPFFYSKEQRIQIYREAHTIWKSLRSEDRPEFSWSTKADAELMQDSVFCASVGLQPTTNPAMIRYFEERDADQFGKDPFLEQIAHIDPSVRGSASLRIARHIWLQRQAVKNFA